jgi:hypothetical protein
VGRCARSCTGLVYAMHAARKVASVIALVCKSNVCSDRFPLVALLAYLLALRKEFCVLGCNGTLSEAHPTGAAVSSFRALLVCPFSLPPSPPPLSRARALSRATFLRRNGVIPRREWRLEAVIKRHLLRRPTPPKIRQSDECAADEEMRVDGWHEVDRLACSGI